MQQTIESSSQPRFLIAIDIGPESVQAPRWKRILVPTRTASDWQRLLAEPRTHWKVGKSAMFAAAAWETSGDKLPLEIVAAFNKSGIPELLDLRLLVALPEWETKLPG